MKLLGIGDVLEDGGIVISITKHGVLTRTGKYERRYSLSEAAAALLWARAAAA